MFERLDKRQADFDNNTMVECKLLVQTAPKINDPRELETILISSIRSLFGELEHHSCGISVVPYSENDDNLPNHVEETSLKTSIDRNDSSSSSSSMFIIHCHSDSLGAIRSALTMVTPPPYLSSKLFRFDVVRVIQG